MSIPSGPWPFFLLDLGSYRFWETCSTSLEQMPTSHTKSGAKNIVGFIGATLKIPKALMNRHLDSDILHLAVAGSNMIILNSVTAAHDLLDKRSLIYSSR